MEIYIDQELYRHIQSKAIAFKDTPNTVLHRLLGVPMKKKVEDKGLKNIDNQY